MTETFTFSTEQFIGLLVAIGGAVFWITYKVRGIEKDVEYMVKRNPYLKAFRQYEEKHASELADAFDETLKSWEKQKKEGGSPI